MKSKLPSACVFTILLLSSFISSCKPDNIDFAVPAKSGKLVSLEITPSSPGMTPGTDLQLEAIGTFSDNTTKNISNSVEWTSANDAIAAVSGTGMVTAPLSGLGPVVITAATGSITDSTTVTVSPLASIAVKPDKPVIAQGTRKEVTATATLQNSAAQDITRFTTWTSSDPGIATVLGPGLFSASSQTSGTSTIAATFSAVTGSTVLTVAPVTSLSITPTGVTIAPGKTVQFSATAGLPGDGKQDVTAFAAWSSFPSEIVAISGTGLGLARSSGSALVTAILGNVQGSAAATVAEPVPASIKVVPDTATLALGTQMQFAAFGSFLDGSVRNCTQDAVFQSSDLQIAFISNASGSKGMVTPIAAGTVTITATCFGISSPAVTLTIIQSAVLSPFVILPANPTIRLGTTIQFTAVSLSSIGPGPADITAEAIWTSSDETIVFVAQGLATSLRPGFATITATFGNFSASTFLTVTSF